MDDFQHLCPVCKVKGIDIFLQLRQINLSTAVYLCKDLKCSYPDGNNWIFVDKNLFQDDESDTDISDSVNEDIENTKAKLELKIRDTGKSINNNHNIDKFNNSNEKVSEVKIPEIVTPVIVNSENTNVVTEDPHDLFSTLSLPNKEESLSVQRVLAVGMPNLEVVDVNISYNSDIAASNNHDKQVQPENKINTKRMVRKTLKNDTVNSKNKLVTGNCNEEIITICNKSDLTAANKDVQIKVENKEINKPDNENNKKKKYSILNTKTTKNKQVSQDEVMKYLNSKKVLVSDKLKIKSIVDKNNALNTSKRMVCDTNNSNNDKSYTKSRKQSCNIQLSTKDPDDLDEICEKPNFESVFKSKLKLQCRKKQQPSFSFDESIIKEALETMNMPKIEQRNKPKRSLVQRIMSKNKTQKVHKKPAAYFDGFQFSSKSLEQNTEHIHISPVQETVSESNICEPKVQITKPSQTVESEKLNETTLDNNNSSVNSIDDISFGELFDNIENLETPNVPSNSANILEVDEWLNLF